MKTAHTSEAINWHLQNNIMPKLTTKTINAILEEVEQFNKGEKYLYSFIGSPTITEQAGEHVTLGEMFDDLKIDIID